LPCAGLAAWRALFVNGHLRCGDVVLIQGTGGVSTFALRFAKAGGATVIATTCTAEKASRLKDLGADYVINHRLDPEWGNTARRMTEDRGVDHVIEIGGAGTLPQSILACRSGAHIALIGAITGYAGQLQTVALITKQIRLIGFTVGSRRDQEDMIRGIDAVGVRPIIDCVFTFEKMADGFRRQESGQHFGKICLTI
jgi:NADPH:quinone reductase-like Zn-dependent oxidoreductase